MTREETIAIIKSAQLMLINPTTNEPVSDLYAALEMAIQALSQEPISLNDINNALEASFRNGVRSAKVEQEPCDDAISRKAVEEITWEEPSYTDALNVLSEVRDKVRALPPVTQKSGKWVRQTDDYHDYYECEYCGIAVGIDDIKNFCPNCGAKMESEDKE